jgi:hypothetical protein
MTNNTFIRFEGDGVTCSDHAGSGLQVAVPFHTYPYRGRGTGKGKCMPEVCE